MWVCLSLSGSGVSQEVDVSFNGGGDVSGGLGVLLVEFMGRAVPPPQLESDFFGDVLVLELGRDSAAEAVGYQERHALLEAGAVFDEFRNNCFSVSGKLGSCVDSSLQGRFAVSVGPSGFSEKEG